MRITLRTMGRSLAVAALFWACQPLDDEGTFDGGVNSRVDAGGDESRVDAGPEPLPDAGAFDPPDAGDPDETPDGGTEPHPGCSLTVPAPLGPAACPQAGIAVSFDDSYVDEWHAARALFCETGARVTFFPTRFPQYDQERIEKLAALQTDGHEIGFHGVSHANAPAYVTEHSLDAYMANEIQAGLDAMALHGFAPESFAYPYGAFTAELDARLLGTFRILRKSGRLTTVAKSYVPRGNTTVVHGVSLDGDKTPLEGVLDAIESACERNAVLVLYGHRIAENDEVESVRPSALRAMFETANAHGLPFLGMSELAPPAR